MSWTAKQHLWKSKAKEGHQLSRGGPSNRQLAKSIISTCASEKREIFWGWDTLYTCECDDEQA